MTHGKKLMFVAAGLLLTCSARAELPRSVRSNVYFTASPIRDVTTKALVRLFEKQEPRAKLKRKKDGHWTTTIVAFLRRKPYPGPITIWLYDKEDKVALSAVSVDGRGRPIFIHELDISPDLGFNKGRTYYVQVGQIIGKRNMVFARGEVELLAERAQKTP